jgi:hypothetical protein
VTGPQESRLIQSPDYRQSKAEAWARFTEAQRKRATEAAALDWWTGERERERVAAAEAECQARRLAAIGTPPRLRIAQKRGD